MINIENSPTIKELNDTLRVLERALDQYTTTCADTANIIKCITKITDKIAELSRF